MFQIYFKVTDPLARVHLGKRTETGVTRLRINCKEWLTRWPELSLSLWVTPPSGAPYTAATHRDGNLLVWTVNSRDTAASGSGTFEVVGEAEGLRKLSSVVETIVR